MLFGCSSWHFLSLRNASSFGTVQFSALFSKFKLSWLRDLNKLTTFSLLSMALHFVHFQFGVRLVSSGTMLVLHFWHHNELPCEPSSVVSRHLLHKQMNFLPCKNKQNIINGEIPFYIWFKHYSNSKCFGLSNCNYCTEVTIGTELSFSPESILFVCWWGDLF